MEYREELKYICSDYEIEILKHRLRALLPYDAHQKNDCYTIRSLYFDTIDDACFHENESGVDNRKKYRIRTYNHSDERIHFEIKEKCHGKTKKSSFPLTRTDCDAFIAGKVSKEVSDSCVGNQILLEEYLHFLHPVITVEYERTAFTYPIGNVRITFDRNISATCDINAFFTEYPPKIPVMPSQMHVLEVKYDELLPDFIAQALELGTLTQSSCSKYSLCRQVCLR